MDNMDNSSNHLVSYEGIEYMIDIQRRHLSTIHRDKVLYIHTNEMYCIFVITSTNFELFYDLYQYCIFKKCMFNFI